MAQTTDYEIANSSGLVFRGRVNEVLAAVQSSNSGATAPTDTTAGMLWLDTSVTPEVLRRRNAADSAWVVVSGDIASQAEAEAGTDNTKLMTSLRVAQAIPAKLNATGSAPVYACRAWVNFNGTGTVAIRASGNVSSITDNGTGLYTANFATAMPDANYCLQGTCNLNTGDGYVSALGLTDSNAQFRTRISGGVVDASSVFIAIFR
jgi:hypothetical protein